jgi:hypothetical protein
MSADPRPLDRARAEKYVGMARKALSSVVEESPACAHRASEILRMATAYVSDAERFLSNGALADAFACANYAHGWLDAGVKLGLLRVTSNRELFASDTR